MLYFLSPALCRIIFGSPYEVSGIFIQHLCPMYCIRFVTSSFSGLFTAYRKQHFEIIYNIMLFLSTVLAYYFAQLNQYDIHQFLSLINICTSLVYFSQLITYIYTAFKFDNQIEHGLWYNSIYKIKYNRIIDVKHWEKAKFNKKSVLKIIMVHMHIMIFENWRIEHKGGDLYVC